MKMLNKHARVVTRMRYNNNSESHISTKRYKISSYTFARC